jgi:hypothetical protein
MWDDQPDEESEMGYRGDDRHGDDRWRDRGEGGGWRGERETRDYGPSEYGREGGGWNAGRREATGWGPGTSRSNYYGARAQGERDWDRGRGGEDDRGFIDRAGDEVRSWFGDEEAQRRREMDERRWERERGMAGRRDNDYGDRDYGAESGRSDYDRDYGAGALGAGGFGGGWGNQAGESWNRERPGRPGWFSDSVGGERGSRRGAGGNEGERYERGGGEREIYGSGDFDRELSGGGFGSPSGYGRRFDRVDAGSTGTHGAHPMSAPVGGGFGTRMSTGREAAILRQQGRYGARGSGGDRGRDYGPSSHDPHYSEWRRRQIEEIDRDYDEYRREHQSKFDEEFGGWRSKRQTQRQMLNRVDDHMEVVGSDGTHVGTVDKVAGDRIILTKSDADAGGMHHSVPCSWIENVDQKVTLNRTAEQARLDWRSEERNRALFERPDSGSEGPHILNRSFAGTYEGGEERGETAASDNRADRGSKTEREGEPDRGTIGGTRPTGRNR